MSDTLRFFIPLEPVGQMRMRVGMRGRHASAFKAPKQVAREDELRDLLRLHAPEFPWSCAMELGVKMMMPIPQSWPKKRKEQARLGLLRPIGKPDISNCIKHIEDVGNGLLWDDDAQIVSYLDGSGKYYSERPGWEVTMKKWAPSGGLLDLAG